MEKSCDTCNYDGASIESEPCETCLALRNNKGKRHAKWEPPCSTCKQKNHCLVDCYSGDQWEPIEDAPEQPLVALGPDSTDQLNPAILPKVLPEGMTRRYSQPPEQFDRKTLEEMCDVGIVQLEELREAGELGAEGRYRLSEATHVFQEIQTILHVPAESVLATPLGAVQRFTKGLKYLQDKLQGDIDRYEGKE